MRLDAEALQEALERCLRERQPVLMVVAVLGTPNTARSTPVDRVVAAARRHARTRGLDFSIHVEPPGAGYWPRCSAMPTAACAVAHEVGADFRAFPATGSAGRVRRARRDRFGAPSIPHKLGYLP
jgi:hypothetical protein